MVNAMITDRLQGNLGEGWCYGWESDYCYQKKQKEQGPKQQIYGKGKGATYAAPVHPNW